jgi:2,4-dienoyl-CoA reductase-like NADH-dependent reductase (Old Yellow Enzyme family)
MTVRLFTPLEIGPLTVSNRILVAPMCQYSAEDGCANAWHAVHLGGLALSGAGLLTLEATAPEPRGRITRHCLGLYSDACEAALAEVLATVRAVSAIPLAIQIGHAGRKAASHRPWEGRGPLGPGAGGWGTLSPSGLPFAPEGPETHEMTRADMDAVRDAHAGAARRAARLGFGMLELHMGHGYLLSSFLSPLSNRRGDGYGGTRAARLRFPLEVLSAVRAAWPSDRALSVKFNGTDWAEGGLTPDYAPEIAGALAEAGADMVTVSGGGVVPGPPPPVRPGYQLEAARRIKAAGIRVRVAAVGMIHAPHFAEAVLAEGAADAVSVARAFLGDPRWALHAAAALGAEAPWPAPWDRASPRNWPPARSRPA